MATKRELLSQAMEEFGISDAAFDITPEELQKGLVRLNRIAAQWDGKGIRVGYNFGTDVDAESGIPDTAENCFALTLAVQWGPAFGKMISMDTKIAAKQALNDLMVSCRVMPEVPYPSRMPLGTGNKRGVMEPQYVQETGEVTGLNDGATEY